MVALVILCTSLVMYVAFVVQSHDVLLNFGMPARY